ncbi:uncharacterized protein LOC121602099 [Anopheles merus]|uniref:uncharacterized protein LOC121602099 n=1 Tax=Anopheles merus TaxID=30066 RepID=UPI001BE3F156|nr:uncharacterized protein LOC121602099 [Anopheles merus]
MPAQPLILSSTRTILIAILARYEEFLQNYQPDRDSIEVETRMAKFDQICKDLESLQQQLEDSATTAEEMTHNAALREDFERRLIRVQSALKRNIEKFRAAKCRSKEPFDKSAPIDIILGARHYASFFTNVKSHELAPNLPTMLNSVFGWVMIGPTSPQNPASTTDCTAASTIVCMASLEESLERFWKLEELSVNDSYSPDERRCETLYKETTQRDESGRYIVRLPKQTDFTEKLGLSKTTALRRFELLERRLERNPQLKEDYHTFMKEYLELGHMSLMNKNSGDEQAYYLPHHPDELLDIVLRFRTYQIALVGDIAKMYRQILLHSDDRRLVRIFFRFSPQAPIQVYELNTVTYGLAPSSFLATRTLIQLADDEGTEYALAPAALKRNFYVDDFIGGANNVREAVQLRKELSALLAKGGFELRKWTSNNLSVLSGLSTEYIGTHSSLHFIPNETVKALGISWKPESDELCFESNTEADEATSTKRSILSSIAKMYDPLGLIAPVIVRAKMLMQELWLL